MIDNRVWFENAIAVAVLITFVMIFLSFFIMAYLVLRHFEEILDALKNSRCIPSDVAYQKTQSFEQRCRVILEIGTDLSRSRTLIRRGELSEDDIKNFPRNLRILLLISNFLFWSALLLSVVWFLMLKVLEYSE